jgi:hypothetical protein
MKRIAILFCILYSSSFCCIAQELTPRFYWPAPIGTKVVVAGYSHVNGDVLMDPSIPLYEVDSRLNTGFLAYMQNFSLLGRTTNILVELPYSWGLTKGIVVNTPAERRLSGFNDLGITLAVNLLGAPAMSPADFQWLRDNPRIILGTSLKIILPTGQYMTDRLINVGANRWAFKPEFGALIPLWPKLLLEIETGVWFFTKDNDFMVGTRKQEPVLSGEVHLVKRFKPGLWISLEANYFWGGRQKIGENQLGDLQRNSKIGGTVAVPIPRRHSFKFGYSIGMVTAYGTDFDQFLVSYTLLLNKFK